MPPASVLETVDRFFRATRESIHEFHDCDYVDDTTFNDITTYMFMLIAYKNWQRPGAVTNLTLKDIEDAEKDHRKIVITCKTHKTASTHGPAILVISGGFDMTFRKYVWSLMYVILLLIDITNLDARGKQTATPF